MKKTWIKRAVQVLVFFMLFVYLFVHFTYAYRDALSHTREHMMGFYSEKKNTVDVVTVGTSATFSAIVPMELFGKYGVAEYDYCTNVMLQESIPYALREIKKTQSPKLVIIDIAPFMFGHNVKNANGDIQQTRYNTDGLKLSMNRFNLINELVPDVKNRLYYYFDFLYYHSNEKPEFKNWNFNVPSVYKGYSNLQIDTTFSEEDIVEPDMSEYHLDEIELNNLDEIFEEIKKQNQEVLFIAQPYLITKKTVERDQKCRAAIKYIEENGFKVLNMHEHFDEIGIDITRDYSMDYLHFNIEGAIKISDYLGGYLCSNYEMQDRREAKKYDKWRSEYAEWTDHILEDNYNWTNTMREKYLENMEK